MDAIAKILPSGEKDIFRGSPLPKLTIDPGWVGLLAIGGNSGETVLVVEVGVIEVDKMVFSELSLYLSSKVVFEQLDNVKENSSKKHISINLLNLNEMRISIFEDPLENSIIDPEF